jgi:hypothetical protein
MTARTLLVPLALAGLALLSCRDSTAPGPGTLAVRVTGMPRPRAVMLQIVGVHDEITVPEGSGWQIDVAPQQGDTVHALVVAPAGTTLGEVVALVHVANTGAVATYQATVIQASAPDYSLIAPATLAVAVQR